MVPILQLQNILHSYNGRTVLDIPEMKLAPGSINGLAGPNGSGKSTLLKILSCTQKSSVGTVSFRGEPVQPFSGRIRHKITLLPQNTYLLRRSVADNIVYGLKIRNRNRDTQSAVSHALELVGLGASFADRSWHELSGGEAQRVALAARLALKPACLLLDEPTASVDMESARCIRRALLLARKEWGTTLVIASHQHSWLNDICDEIFFIYNGRLLAGSFENILLGPWVPAENDLYCMQLTDGQNLFVTRPRTPTSSAVFEPAALTVTTALPETGRKSLKGIVTGIFLDRQHDLPRIHVACGDQRFVAAGSVTASTISYHPGEKVFLHYTPDDVQWLPE